jgi:hypothetical protein
MSVNEVVQLAVLLLEARFLPALASMLSEELTHGI